MNSKTITKRAINASEIRCAHISNYYKYSNIHVIFFYIVITKCITFKCMKNVTTGQNLFYQWSSYPKNLIVCRIQRFLLHSCFSFSQIGRIRNEITLNIPKQRTSSPWRKMFYFKEKGWVVLRSQSYGSDRFLLVSTAARFWHWTTKMWNSRNLCT